MQGFSTKSLPGNSPGDHAGEAAARLQATMDHTPSRSPCSRRMGHPSGLVPSFPYPFGTLSSKVTCSPDPVIHGKVVAERCRVIFPHYVCTALESFWSRRERGTQVTDVPWDLQTWVELGSAHARYLISAPASILPLTLLGCNLQLALVSLFITSRKTRHNCRRGMTCSPKTGPA